MRRYRRNGFLLSLLLGILGFSTYEMFFILQQRHLFGTSPTEKSVPLQGTLPDLVSNLPETKMPSSVRHAGTENALLLPPLQARLVGTLVGKSSAESRAFIDEQLKHQLIHLQIGDTIQERVLTQINLGKIHLKRPDGKEEILAIEYIPASLEMIQELQPGIYRVDKQQLAHAIQGNVPTIMAKAKPQPYIHQFQLVGFRLSKVEQQDLLAKAGLQSEDIITSINGKAINQLSSALAIYDEARHSDKISVEVLREGQSRTLRYRLE